MANEQRRAGAGWNVGVISLMIAAMLVGLPLAVWLDLRNLVASNLLRQANDVNSVISSMRSYYSTNVVGRILAAPEGATRVSAHFETIPGAIPIPSTLSLELGRVIGVQQKNIRYRFVSDYPFKGRAPHALDDFETGALANLRADPTLEPSEVSGGWLSDNVRVAVPVVMGAACVACHNSDPDSPKRDWKVGDVRGIQEVSISQPIAVNLFSFKYLLIYFAATAAMGLAFIRQQSLQANEIRGVNAELERANDFLASLSIKISRYLSPQIYKSIFSGQKDVTIHTSASCSRYSSPTSKISPRRRSVWLPN